MSTEDERPDRIVIDKRTLDASINAVCKLTDQVLDLRVLLEATQRLLEATQRQRADYAAQLVMMQMDRDEWQAKAKARQLRMDNDPDGAGW